MSIITEVRNPKVTVAKQPDKLSGSERDWKNMSFHCQKNIHVFVLFCFYPQQSSTELVLCGENVSITRF